MSPQEILKFYVICIALAGMAYFLIERPSQKAGRFVAQRIKGKMLQRKSAKTVFA